MPVRLKPYAKQAQSKKVNMRLIVHGQQAFGQAVLDRLLERGENVVAVYCAPESGSRPDPLKLAAQQADIPVYQPATYKSQETADSMSRLNADLCIMAYVTLIVPSAVLNIPKYGSIQYHPSLLPDHKGPSSINWPIIQGKQKTGLTIFWPDDGLDTGPILLQKEIDIQPDDTLGSLYFNKLFPLGVDAMIQALDMVKDGVAPRVPQDPDAGSYEGWCVKNDAAIDWNKPVSEVYNLIRGTNPQPGAWTTYKGSIVKIFDSSKSSQSNGSPGTITAIDADGIHVATKGGQIVVERMRSDAGKVSASEFVEQSGLQVNERLGT